MTLRRIIAENIKYWRGRRQLSQEALADLAALHRNYVGAVERFEKNISVDNVERIANALQIDPKELMRKRSTALPPNIVGYRLGDKRKRRPKKLT